MGSFHPALILVLIFALVLVYARQLWNGIRASRRTRTWEERKARIVDLKTPEWVTAPFTRRFSRFVTRTIEIVLEYEYENKLYRGTKIAIEGLYVTNLTVTRLYKGLDAAFREEAPVRIWVNPLSPEEAVLLRQNDGFAAVGGGLIVVLLGAIAVMVAIGAKK
jgi:hypothetical protein